MYSLPPGSDLNHRPTPSRTTQPPDPTTLGTEEWMIPDSYTPSGSTDCPHARSGTHTIRSSGIRVTRPNETVGYKSLVDDTRSIGVSTAPMSSLVWSTPERGVSIDPLTGIRFLEDNWVLRLPSGSRSPLFTRGPLRPNLLPQTDLRTSDKSVPRTTYTIPVPFSNDSRSDEVRSSFATITSLASSSHLRDDDSPTIKG